jgi:hypothetical protein
MRYTGSRSFALDPWWLMTDSLEDLGSSDKYLYSLPISSPPHLSASELPPQDNHITIVTSDMDDFTVDSFPDIQPDTHIIAVCGIPKVSCDLAQDGWFFSDFFLLNHMLKGLGASQHWYTSVDPQYIITTHGQLLHGNRTHARRIVLDQATRPRDVIVLGNEADLLQDFLQEFRKICDQAYKESKPVFLMIFGHGDEDTSGVFIGRNNREEAYHWPMLTRTHIRNICRSRPGLQCSIMSTACFAGPWTEITSVAAMTASNDMESLSWPKSDSLGRFGGGVFCSVLASVLEETNPPEYFRDTGSEKQISYREMTSLMKSRVREIDMAAKYQNFTFSAQENDWERECHQRTGIPISEYTKRLKALCFLPAQSGASAPALEQTFEHLRLHPEEDRAWHSLMRRTGSAGGRFVILKNMAGRYMDSFPGNSAIPSNHAVHSFADLCIQGKLGEEKHWQLMEMLIFRQEMGKLANALVIVMSLNPFPPMWEWDHYQWLEENKLSQSDSTIRRAIGRVLPVPGEHEGRKWSKPAEYLTCACMTKDLTIEDVEARLVEAKAYIKMEAMKKVERVFGNESQGRPKNAGEEKWFKTLGATLVKRVRAMSPRKGAKRMSLGSDT